MELDMTQVAADIASSTTGYLGTFGPIILLVGGLVLAIVVITALITILTGRRADPFDDEEGADII